MTPEVQRGGLISRTEALLSKSRHHLQLMDRELHHLAALRQTDRPAYQRLTAVRAALEAEIQQTEAQFAGFAPDYVRASRTGPLQPRKVPEAVREMPAFRSMLGLPAVRGATSTGPEVENLQRILCWQGHSVAVDGQFSMHTQLALVKWQKQAGLPADGVLGAATRRVLNALIRAGVQEEEET